MKKFNITFTEKRGFSPATRTVMVEANDELHARNVFASVFDTFTFNKKLMAQVPSGKRVTVTKVKEIKEDKN